MKLVAGLGNPGDKYEHTRHNTGWLMLDLILGKKADWNESAKGKTLFHRNSTAGKPVEYLKPITFMNNSGFAILYAKEKHKVPLKDIVVIYDDIDLPIGKMKISFNKSSGGHNGLESVIKKLKSKEFVRIRLGISGATPKGAVKKPKGEKAVINFILGEFKKPELETLKKLSKKITEIVETIFSEGKDKAMSLYN